MQSPTPEPSKNYAVDFQAKIAAKNILRFHQLALFRRWTAAQAVSKSTVISFKADEIGLSPHVDNALRSST